VPEPLGGVIAAPVTPFDDDLRVDTGTLERVCDFQIRHGADAIGLPLHTAESLNLSMHEREQVVQRAVKACAGRVPVLAHVSMPGTGQVIELARRAEAAGASAVIVVTPYHWRPSPAELLAHFTAVAGAVTISVLGYNFPGRLGVALTPDLLEELIDRCQNFTGVKDASYDMQSFTEACRRTAARRPGFSMFTGVEYLLTSMPVGGAGCFSPASAIAPRLVRGLYDSCLAGDFETARAAQHRASALWHLLRETGYPASVKAAMTLYGRPAGGVRLPLLDPGPAAVARLSQGLGQLGLLDSEPHGWS
jgi:4-hydroxy-tetrahydrodipicolinate synthase